MICTGLVAAGCGGEPGGGSGEAEDDPRAVAQKLIAAVTAGHPVPACRLFLVRTGKVWFGRPCDDPLLPLPPHIDSPFAHSEVRSVRVHGATAHVVTRSHDYGERGLILWRTARGWRIYKLSEGSRAARQDKEAIDRVGRTFVALLLYADARGGSFAGAHPRDLRRYSKLVPRNVKVTSTRDAFTIEVTSRSGNVFRHRGAWQGVDEHTCETAGVGKCPPDGDWG